MVVPTLVIYLGIVYWELPFIEGVRLSKQDCFSIRFATVYNRNRLESKFLKPSIRGHIISHLRRGNLENTSNYHPNYSCGLRERHFFTFCDIPLQDIWNEAPIWRKELINAIAPSSLQGDRGCYDIFLVTSYDLSSKLYRRVTLHEDNNFEYGYDYLVERGETGYLQIAFHELHGVNYFDMDALHANDGVIQLSFLFKDGSMLPQDTNVRMSSFAVPKRIMTEMKKRFLKSRLKPHGYPNEIFYFLKRQVRMQYPEILFPWDAYVPWRAKSHKEIRNRMPLQKKKDLREVSNPLATSHGNSQKSEEEGTPFRICPRTKRRLKFKHNLKKEKPRGVDRTKDSEMQVRSDPQIRKRRGISSEKEESSLRLRVRFSLDKLASEGGLSEQFNQHIKKQLAKRIRVPLSSVKEMTIQSGTDVSFILSPFNDENNLMDDQSVFEAADFLKKEVDENKLRLTDLNGHLLMTVGSAYVSKDDNGGYYSLVVLIVLCTTLLFLLGLIIVLVYIARRFSKKPKSSNTRHKAYRNMDFGRDSSQSVGKYSYDSGLWVGPGSEPIFEVPEAPYYRPPTVEEVSSTPRPITAVRTRLKRNWNVDERALSTIPDDHGRPPLQG